MENDGELYPSCSEVVCRLPFATLDLAKEELEKMGIDVMDIDLYPSFRFGEDGDSVKQYILADRDNINLLDFEHGAHLALFKDEYEVKGIGVVGHQHCQSQLFKTIQKIENKLGFEFKGWDGGYSFEDDFMEWLGSPTLEDYQEEIRKKVKDILNRLEKNGFYLGSEYKEIESNVKILLGKNESEKLDYEDEEVVKVLYWISKDDRVKWHLFEKPKVLKGVIRKKRKV